MFKHIIYDSDKLITKKPNTKGLVPNEKFRESSAGEQNTNQFALRDLCTTCILNHSTKKKSRRKLLMPLGAVRYPNVNVSHLDAQVLQRILHCICIPTKIASQ